MANNDEKRYTIGQMAKLCNVTTKQLRHYDENNILSPCYKDEETNYRYYSESQLAVSYTHLDVYKRQGNSWYIQAILHGNHTKRLLTFP